MRIAAVARSARPRNYWNGRTVISEGNTRICPRESERRSTRDGFLDRETILQIRRIAEIPRASRATVVHTVRRETSDAGAYPAVRIACENAATALRTGGVNNQYQHHQYKRKSLHHLSPGCLATRAMRPLPFVVPDLTSVARHSL